MTHIRSTTTIVHAPRAAAVPPGGPLDRDQLGAAMTTLGGAKVKLAGTIVEHDFRLLRELRRDMFAAAQLLRLVATSGGLFPAEYRAGAADAARAARTLGRVHVELERFARISGGYYGIGWPQMERRALAMLERAKAAMNRAYEAAYTGTHY